MGDMGELSGDPKWPRKPDFSPTSIQVGCAGQETISRWFKSWCSGLIISLGYRGLPAERSTAVGFSG
jgi:hypothetical protein